jgi:hypothetical protein
MPSISEYRKMYKELDKEYKDIKKKYDDFLSGESKRCRMCQRIRKKGAFYATNNKMADSDGKMSICSDCLSNYCMDMMLKTNNDYKLSILKTCALANIEYNEEAIDDMLNDPRIKDPSGNFVSKFFGIYKSKLQFLISRDNLDGEHTFNPNKDVVRDISKQTERVKSRVENIKDLENKWGYGYSERELSAFEKKYEYLLPGYKIKTPLHEERLKSYVVHKVKEELATADGNVADAAKWQKMAKDSANDAKLNVRQLSKSDITGGIDLVPQLVEAVEEEASIIPIMPKLTEVAYDDADLIIWATTRKNCQNAGLKPPSYREIYEFYDKALEDYFEEQGFTKEEAEKEREKRKTVFRDLSDIYIDPLEKDDSHG